MPCYSPECDPRNYGCNSCDRNIKLVHEITQIACELGDFLFKVNSTLPEEMSEKTMRWLIRHRAWDAQRCENKIHNKEK